MSKRVVVINYEKATAPAFAAVAALDREAWKSNRNSEFIPDGEHAWRLWVEHALVFVARENNEIIGAILAFPCISGKWCVHKVFVRRDKQNQGIGVKLFAALLKEIDRIGADCFLTVDPINEGAMKLYEKWGFRAREYIKGYYRDKEDRFVLTRKFLGQGSRVNPSACWIKTAATRRRSQGVCRGQ